MDQKLKKKEVLITANEYINRLIPGVETTINLFRDNLEIEALEFLKNITEGLQWLSEVILLTRDIQLNKIKVNDINEHIQEIISAIELRDYILISDILEYEVLPILIKWKECISTVE